MFDKLVESEPAGADFKNRCRYFMVSSVVVGILFTTAVVISIFAADYGLGNSSFELVEMMAVVDSPPDAEPEPQPRQQQPASSSRSTSDVPMRTESVARTDESRYVPTSISASPSNLVSRPRGDYSIGLQNRDPGAPGGTGRDIGDQSGTDLPSGLSQVKKPVDEKEVDPPPPTVTKKPEAPKAPVSKGVLNGYAKSLPKPLYSAAAKAVRAQGKVTVQVTIDESGNVISAKAVDGNPLLRPDAEKAARSARFSPTLLSEVPVKVTGLITYNFVL